MAVKKQNKSIEKILKGLYSTNQEEIHKALDLIPTKGNKEVILPLLELYANHPSEDIKAKVRSIILQLKSEDSITPLFEALGDKKFEGIQDFIISAFWNNNFDMGDYLDVLTKYAVNGDYLTALEVLTVIENQEGPFHEEMLMDAIVTSREFLSENKEDEKRPLLISLNRILENFELNQ